MSDTSRKGVARQGWGMSPVFINPGVSLTACSRPRYTRTSTRWDSSELQSSLGLASGFI